MKLDLKKSKCESNPGREENQETAEIHKQTARAWRTGKAVSRELPRLIYKPGDIEPAWDYSPTEALYREMIALPFPVDRVGTLILPRSRVL